MGNCGPKDFSKMFFFSFFAARYRVDHRPTPTHDVSQHLEVTSRSNGGIEVPVVEILRGATEQWKSGGLEDIRGTYHTAFLLHHHKLGDVTTMKRRHGLCESSVSNSSCKVPLDV